MSCAKDEKAWCVFASVIVGFTLSAAAQTPPPAQPAAPAPKETSKPATAPAAMAPGLSKPTTLAAVDKKFIENAAQGGMAEVKLGQLAAQKASDPQVKQFAEKMVADHSKANDKLKKIASDKGVILPADTTTAEKREYDKLSKMTGAAFDREYMKHALTDHKKDASEFKSATRLVRDPDLKQFATETLPTVEEHLALAKSTVPKK
jgi:putative membrane protein